MARRFARRHPMEVAPGSVVEADDTLTSGRKGWEELYGMLSLGFRNEAGIRAACRKGSAGR